MHGEYARLRRALRAELAPSASQPRRDSSAWLGMTATQARDDNEENSNLCNVINGTAHYLIPVTHT
jgi:hypothetical protein